MRVLVGNVGAAQFATLLISSAPNELAQYAECTFVACLGFTHRLVFPLYEAGVARAAAPSFPNGTNPVDAPSSSPSTEIPTTSGAASYTASSTSFLSVLPVEPQAWPVTSNRICTTPAAWPSNSNSPPPLRTCGRI